jgi:hypothetical protein
MAEPLDNPRALRESNRRWEYDRRNKGVDQAMLNMQARNAARRESDRRAAERKATDEIVNATDRALRKNPRLFNSAHFSGED